MVRTEIRLSGSYDSWDNAGRHTATPVRIGSFMKEQALDHLLDDIGWKILTELQQNARIPFAELGRIVGLSTPAVTERVHKMEEAGIIVGYRAHIDPAKVGLPMLAFVNVKVGGENLGRFMELAATHPEVLECHRVTGAESFLLKVAVSDVAHLERLLDALMPYVATTTSMVLSTALAWGNIVKPDKEQLTGTVRSKS